MHFHPLVLAGILIAIFLFLKLLKAQKGGPKGFPYVRCELLLTLAERSFFGVLQNAVGSDYHIFTKVRLADVLRVQPGVSGKDWRSAFNRISSKHADFVACYPKTFSVVGVIELDYSSHDGEKARRDDQFKDKAFAAASIPLLRIPAQRSYSPQELREQVRASFA